MDGWSLSKVQYIKFNFTWYNNCVNISVSPSADKTLHVHQGPLFSPTCKDF